jgi:hypothetical protein
MVESRNVYKILVGKPERKRPLGRPRRRYEDNIIMNLRGIGWEDVEWIHLSQDRNQTLSKNTVCVPFVTGCLLVVI